MIFILILIVVAVGIIMWQRQTNKSAKVSRVSEEKKRERISRIRRKSKAAGRRKNC
jgi:uncharacterized membrane protein